eukprot:7197553-Prorocentrum_lima.AAC.1
MESLPPEEPASDLVAGTGVLSEDPLLAPLHVAPPPSVPEAPAFGGSASTTKHAVPPPSAREAPASS